MNVPKTLIIVGIIFILFGIIFSFFRMQVGWFGNLFGDISYKTEKFHFYMPLLLRHTVKQIRSLKSANTKVH